MRFNKICVNTDYLKITALVLMTADHVAKIFPNMFCANILQILGSMSFPIFSFILMFHLQRKQIYKKYLLRLGSFAFLTFLTMKLLRLSGVDISGVPFNILFMFFVCVLALALKKTVEEKIKNRFVKNVAICSVYILCAALVSRLSLFAFVYVILIYFFFEKKSVINIIALSVFAYLTNLGGIGGLVAVAVSGLLINVNYDKKYQRIIKKWYIFYLYYPLHLAVLLLIGTSVKLLVLRG